MRATITVLLLLVSFGHNCSGQENNALKSEIQDIMTQYQSVGISAVVVKDNKICYNQTFGYNPDYDNAALRTSIPEDGVYWLASVSKTFISTAIMQLVEKRKVKLDGDINKYLKYYVRNPKYPNIPITVRMLLCHRSSLNDSQYGWTMDMLEAENEKYAANFNDYKPGNQYDYCNLGYSLLAAIIEGVTGMRFDEYIDKNICEPLGMNASFNLTKMDEFKLVHALLYNQEKKEFYADKSIYNYRYIQNKLNNYELGKSTAYLSPAGGMRMSATDLAKWMMVHMNYGKYDGTRIIRKRTEKAMWKPQASDRNYAFAFSQYDKVVEGENFYGMTGGSHGIHSLFFFNPKKKYGFVVICNGCNSKWGNGGDMNYKIVETLYNHFIKK